ncbi:hypothetical protein DXV76_15150 [Rhodobacteraceae bacterium CCMM004]|nr:hypothetical protein DXV76_15150 [Rhodobacteraceae bacterium CCMM004]
MILRRLLPLMLAGALAGQAQAGCAPDIAPVVSLEFGSRYVAGDTSRSVVDRDGSKAATAALRPVDTFVRTLARDANAALAQGDRTEADCVVARIVGWADADALSDLGTLNARLAVGSRLAGIAEAYRQVRPLSSDTAAQVRIEAWLAARTGAQRQFWEVEAPHGARSGNLRAWAALAVWLSGDLTGDDAGRYWALASAARILCTARPDGSLPQETKRGAHALYYQLHAVAPLAVLAAHADPRGHDLSAVCDGALARSAGFALEDYAAEGAASEAYSGQPQAVFARDPSKTAHLFAWLPAYLTLGSAPRAEAMIDAFATLGNSKLGGDQHLLWPRL